MTLAQSSWHYLCGEASGTRYDTGPNSRNLTDINTVGTATGKLSSNAAHFVAASSERLEHPANSAFNWSGDGTLMAWIKLNSTGGSATKGFAGVYNGSQNDWIASYEPTISRFRIYWERTSSSLVLPANNFGAPSAGVWYWFCAQKEGSTGRISINNGSFNTGVMSGTASPTAKFTLGGLEAGYYLDCDLQQVVRFPFVTTAAEQAYVYNSGNGRLLA